MTGTEDSKSNIAIVTSSHEENQLPDRLTPCDEAGYIAPNESDTESCRPSAPNRNKRRGGSSCESKDDDPSNNKFEPDYISESEKDVQISIMESIETKQNNFDAGSESAAADANNTLSEVAEEEETPTVNSNRNQQDKTDTEVVPTPNKSRNQSI